MSTVTLTNLAGYVWGIGADETSINIERFTAKANGKMKTVPNRQSLIVGRCDFQFEKTYSISGFVTGSSAGSAIATNIGIFITVANDVSLGGIPSGQGVFVNDLETTQIADDLKRITYNMSAYPGIGSGVTQTTT